MKRSGSDAAIRCGVGCKGVLIVEITRLCAAISEAIDDLEATERDATMTRPTNWKWQIAKAITGLRKALCG